MQHTDTQITLSVLTSVATGRIYVMYAMRPINFAAAACLNSTISLYTGHTKCLLYRYRVLKQ